MKHILITGASTGIGFALAHGLVSKGYFVFGSVRKQDDADRLRSEFGDHFMPLIFDVRDHDAIRSSLPVVAEKAGKEGLAGLVNNAGVALTGPTQLLPIDIFRKQLEINLFGSIVVTQTFLKLLGAYKNCPHPPGRILNISSVSGKIGFPFMGPYNASKFAMEGWSHALRRELLPFGVDVIIIGPGAIKTPIWDKGSPEPPEEVINSDYGQALLNLRKEFYKQAAKAMPVELLAEKVIKVFESSGPRTRYTFLNNKFVDYTIPRLLPDRVLDKFIGKLFKSE